MYQTVNGDFSGKGHFYFVSYEFFIISFNIFFSTGAGRKIDGPINIEIRRSSLSFHTFFNIISIDYKDKM